MPDDVTGGTGDAPEEPGDLTARLRMLEERISSEGATAPARRRRTPVKPYEPYAPPPLHADDPLSAALEPSAGGSEPVDEATPIESDAAPEVVSETEPGAAEEPSAPPPVVDEPAEEPAPPPPVEDEPAEEPPPPAATTPARATPVKRAPATKAPAKKAPAKKAPAKKTTAAASAGEAPARQAARREPAKKAPNKRPPAAPLRPVAVADLAGTTPVRPAPRPNAPVRPPVVPTPIAARRPTDVSTQGLPAATTVLAPARDRLVALLGVVTILLLALAAGLGAAAFVENRDRTWSSVTVVRLDPGNDPQSSIDDALTAGMSRYLDQASSPAFTVSAASRAGVPSADVRADLVATQRAPRQIALVAKAATAKQAEALAAGAGDALVELVQLDQSGSVSSEGDRLSAAVVAPPSDLTKVTPSNGSAWAAGLLAGGAVLLLTGVAFLLRVTRSR